MSIIIYGPQGCGKTRHGNALRRHYKMRRLVEDDGLGRLFNGSTFERIKVGADLILTNETPPAHLKQSPHVVAFDDAMKAAGLRASKGAAA